MSVDRNLFLYDLAVVSILKNEGPYVKEWLDYHLLAGVDHFYIYDNESPDNLKEVLQPYIEKNIVTYTFYPGKARQNEAYNDAVRDYKFFCRYMAFIDGDEFIFPKNNKRILEVVDEIFSDKPKAAALGINMHNFGSNYQEKADYNRGVLERFTRRATDEGVTINPETGLPTGGNGNVKTIADPRKIDYFFNPHFALYFEGYIAVNSSGNFIEHAFSTPPVADKIVLNHYGIKSREEWSRKVARGTADSYNNIYKEDGYSHNETTNKIFDSEILKYRNYLRNNFLSDGGDVLENLAPSKQVDNNKIFNALVQNLSPLFGQDVSEEFFLNQMEKFLVCRAAGAYLREKKILNEQTGKFFEEISLESIYQTIFTISNLADIRLLIAELPKILQLKYPAAQKIRQACIEIISQMTTAYRTYDKDSWTKLVQLKYLSEMLKIV